MTSTTQNGGVPGSNTPIEKGQGAPSTLTPKTDTNKADFRNLKPIPQAHAGKQIITRLKTAHARIKDRVSGFYLERGVGIQAIVAVITLAAFAMVRAMQ